MMRLLHGHAVLGDTTDALRQIQRDEVNLVACPIGMSEAASSYVESLDLSWDGRWMTSLRTRAADRCSFNSILLTTLFFQRDEDICTQLVFAAMKSLPNTTGRAALAETLATAAREFAAQAAGAGQIGLELKVKYPMAHGEWHADNLVDKRCFLTLNRRGSGTYWRPNSSVPNWPCPEHDRYSNDFGTFGEEYMADAEVIPARHFAIWKGRLHRQPLVHAECTSRYSTEPRLVSIIQRSTAVAQ